MVSEESRPSPAKGAPLSADGATVHIQINLRLSPGRFRSRHRNLQIRDDQIEVFLFQQGTGFTSISCRPYTMIAASQNGSDGCQHGIIVIHYEDSSIPSKTVLCHGVEGAGEASG